MHSKILGLGLISGLMSAAAFAEPPIQPGDTLESLSKVKVVTTVNGQPGSIEELVASGQIKLTEAADVTASSANQTLNPDQAQANQIDVSDDVIQASPEAPQADESIQAAPESADIDSTVN